MSTLVTVNILISDDGVLKEALDELGIKYSEKPGEISLEERGKQKLKKVDGSWQLTGNEYAISRTQKTLMAKVEQIYAVAKFKKEMKKLGCVINNRETTKDGRVKMKVLVP